MTSQARRRTLLVGIALVLIAIGAIGRYLVVRRHAGLPSADSEAYEQMTRRFYRGLAELQVGLIDAAKQDFTQATALAPGEPASWANLGLAHLRLAEFDAAAPALERAAALAPASSDIAFLLGRLETARGRREEGIAQLRRAIALDARHLQARTALIQEIETSGGSDADAEAQRQLDQLLALQPDNAAVLVDRARLAAKRSDAATLKDSLRRLAPFTNDWPPDVVEQYRAIQDASAGSNFAETTRGLAFLRNLLAQVPLFLESRRLVTPSAELVADPLTRFLRLPTPLPTPSAADEALTFSPEFIGEPPPAPFGAVLAFSPDGDRAPAIFAADARGLRRVDAAGPTLAFPEGRDAGSLPANGLLALDWNNDFRMDIAAAAPGGVRLFIQGAGGAFTDETARASRDSGPLALDATGVWAADIEMDGDVDLVVGVRTGAPVVLRNNGDGTWRSVQPFDGVTGLQAFVWADLDADGDPDAALIDGGGDLRVFANLQSGQFQLLPPPAHHTDMRALAVGDADADGVIDMVTLDANGFIERTSRLPAGWSQASWTSWQGRPRGPARDRARLILMDLDNNGALDLLASDSSGTAIWLADEARRLRPLARPIDADIWQVDDLGGDGQLDLVGLSAGRPVRLTGKGTRGYHYQIVRPRAQRAAGDQRINSFGIGGEVEVRSGRLVQKQTITGPTVHVGLGDRTSIDVTRIVWPNGVPQAEFDPHVDQPIVAEQRLKGSCPWVFADDGTGMRFVTDFLWRSPLGLRINAQDTAGVTQTEDWVKIRGDQLAARDGAYDVRVTAELWETHFIDQAALLVVDHPGDVSVFVDERFAREPPALAVRAMQTVQPIAHAWDETGRDVTDLVTRQDGRYLSTFALGAYQGVAADHFVDIDPGAAISGDAPAWLVAYGWIYPTDSSINVAIGQGAAVRPRGVSLEAQDARGRWVVVAPDLGFPEGKNKTMLIDLRQVARAGVTSARRLRLRTNLEIYWDFLATARDAPGAPLQTRRLDPVKADLRYRGFSETRHERRDQPELPVYERIANTAPRWRDLIGQYTRFGDVRELLGRTDDRYVIMNAGDELRLSFSAPPPPAAGWTRDFVLIGDGWEKDGDYNTSFSKTVLPLPAHDHPRYEAASPALRLDQDPVYLRHRADWETFHTRIVSPSDYLSGLRLAGPPGHR